MMRVSRKILCSFLLGWAALTLSACGQDPKLPVCGNGEVEGRELCDDGNLVAGDGCDENCLLESRELCDNGEDDDGDGSADCADPDCFAHPRCQGDEVCSNGFDDDGDGLTDCEDPDCAEALECLDEEQCSNGLDDDGDGDTDCEDADCAGHAACGGCDPDLSLGPLSPGDTRSTAVDTAESVGLPSPSCAAGPPAYHLRFTVAVGFHLRLSAAPVDDGLVVALFREEQPGLSCETDELRCEVLPEELLQLEQTGLPPGTYRLVVGPAEGSTTGQVQLSFSILPGGEEICDNGVDDDGDGLVDCDDDECAGSAGCLVEICDNGTDDDGDALIDCDDPDCASAPACLPPEICGNGVDDDGDSKIDCADVQCSGTATCVGSDCVVNADFGQLGRGAQVVQPFDTALATDDNAPSCGGDGPEVVYAFSLSSPANVVVALEQSGDHVLAVTGEAGPGSWCDSAELRCVDPGGSGRSVRTTLVGLPAARYFVLVDTVSGDRTGLGTVSLSVHDPLQELCDDQVDDDGDGLTDCADPDCFAHPLCLPESLCHDDLDNDGDGHRDCADFDCVGTAACGPGACVPQRDLGTLQPGVPVLATVDTTSASDLFTVSCARGGGGGDVVLRFQTTTPGDLHVNASQLSFSDHAVALMCAAGPGSACDAAEHRCVDGGSPGLPIAAVVPGMPPGEYFLVAEPYGPGGAGGLQLELGLYP